MANLLLKEAPGAGADYENLMSPVMRSSSTAKRPDLETGGDGQPQGASFWILLAVSMPRMAVNMAWAAQWAALSPYLSTMLPNYAVQLTSVIGPIVGIIFGPMIGVISDRS
ncbi:Glycoside-Pentoside-Hexuronide family transporter, partial [Phytophthora megakarya]